MFRSASAMMDMTDMMDMMDIVAVIIMGRKVRKGRESQGRKEEETVPNRERKRKEAYGTHKTSE